ncbi:hypothetical protein Phum_PHUM127560 [Pediculus humanus corporis]|uniref:RRM domain-containing protein n=1 Tax=Pediculus humanus subsp. corporis TaxID=121224 RepID=E0VE09_PEDHC|nr:uncharacterized protein Phum_PHUM127560 [Pediculus humanus corporis]EEB11615.1 hypothetical protein Phum_PHUM127560 [Pediculus humanus corporis]
MIYFARLFAINKYGRVQSVKLLPGSNGSICAAVAFMDIKSASKAHNCEHTLDEHSLSTEYYEPGPYTSSQQRFPIG